MKKILIISLFTFLLITSFVSAINFQMKDTFNQEEVLTAKISGDFIRPPLEGNIFLYRGHVRAGIEAYLTKIGDNYYIYAPLLGKTAGNYSLVIENVEYEKARKTIEEDLVKNFSITENLTEFTISKGFISTKEDFYIELENLQDEDITVVMNITTIFGEEGGITSFEEDEEYEFVISPGRERIDFDFSVKEQTIKLIQFSTDNTTYVIPASLFIDEYAEESKYFSFKIEPKEIDMIMPTTGEPLKRLVYIYNKGTGTFTDIRLTFSDSLKPFVTISEDRFGRILPGSNAHFNLSITPTSEQTISGELLVETGQKLTNTMRIVIKFEEGYEADYTPEISTDEKCEEVGGKICTENEVCKIDTFRADDGICCPGGQCIKKVTSSLGKIIGYLLILVLIVAAVWFFMKKHRNIKSPIDLLKIAKGKK